MTDPRVDPNDELVRVLSETAERVLAGERAYSVAHDATNAMLAGPIVLEARHGGIAYVLWGSIADMFDDPRGPYSEEACQAFAQAASTDWQAINARSAEAIASYFQRWDPGSKPRRVGSAWRAVANKWPAAKDPASLREPLEDDATVRSIKQAVERYAADESSRDIQRR